MEHVRTLADPSLRGRSPGSAGDHRAARYIREQLKRAGFEPVTDVGKSPSWTQPFTLTLPDIGFFNLRLTRDKELMEPASWPVIGSPEGRYETTITTAGHGIVAPSRDDYNGVTAYGKAVLVRDGLPEGVAEPEGGALELLERKIKEAAERGAAALMVAVEGPMPEAYIAMTAYPSIPSPALKAQTAKLKSRGQFASLPAEIMKLQSRSQAIEVPSIPVLILPGAEEWLTRLEEAREAPYTMRLNLHYRRQRWKTRNVIGYLLGSDPALRSEIIILGAHYDALGPSPTGKIFLGADDNASGVAALLEASRLLARQRGWLKRSLMVIAFGAEEWGLVGSRYYLEHPSRDLARTTVLLNVDAVSGRTPAALAYLIGRSYYPGLAATAEAYIGEVGLAVGRDIDQHAFRLGSDHWPFHKAGIPVLDFWASNYKRMNTAQDIVENLDEDKLERMARLIYLTALDLLTAPESNAHGPAKAP
jgi:acetylornithine deacetylase/succinyl-diaminopimelate desuccinylase-like protein